MARLLNEWLPPVLHYRIGCFVSTDTPKGDNWLLQLDEQLRGCEAGIICLTRACARAPWILFEAGALAIKLQSSAAGRKRKVRRVCPLVVDMEIEELTLPLSMLMASTTDRPDMRELVKVID